jgi:hypothetical protein
VLLVLFAVIVAACTSLAHSLDQFVLVLLEAAFPFPFPGLGHARAAHQGIKGGILARQLVECLFDGFVRQLLVLSSLVLEVAQRRVGILLLALPAVLVVATSRLLLLCERVRIRGFNVVGILRFECATATRHDGSESSSGTGRP